MCLHKIGQLADVGLLRRIQVGSMRESVRQPALTLRIMLLSAPGFL